MSLPIRDCPGETCERYRGRLIRGMCRSHYNEWAAARPGQPRRAGCSISGCETQRIQARGMCSKHYARWKFHGDPLWQPTPRPRATHCAVDNCGDAAAGGRYCSKHRARLTRLGTTDLPIRRDRHEHSMGYQLVKRPGHPLAHCNGWVYEHRVALFDLIGPGWHTCHHCGVSVSWELTYPKHPDALVVDHLDEDPANNDPSNLVPSCAPCNFARSSRWKKRKATECR